jgi:hypothetical protein
MTRPSRRRLPRAVVVTTVVETMTDLMTAMRVTTALRSLLANPVSLAKRGPRMALVPTGAAAVGVVVARAARSSSLKTAKPFAR